MMFKFPASMASRPDEKKHCDRIFANDFYERVGIDHTFES